jgi:hypothetical protein
LVDFYLDKKFHKRKRNQRRFQFAKSVKRLLTAGAARRSQNGLIGAARFFADVN